MDRVQREAVRHARDQHTRRQVAASAARPGSQDEPTEYKPTASWLPMFRSVRGRRTPGYLGDLRD